MLAAISSLARPRADSTALPPACAGTLGTCVRKPEGGVSYERGSPVPSPGGVSCERGTPVPSLPNSCQLVPARRARVRRRLKKGGGSYERGTHVVSYERGTPVPSHPNRGNARHSTSPENEIKPIFQRLALHWPSPESGGL